MATLTIVEGLNAGHCFELRGPQAVLGRQRGCDIILPAGKVSRRHARIVQDEQGHTIEDLNSRNGTFINGQRVVARQRLRDSDQIGLGDFLLTFHEQAPSARPAPPRSTAPVRESSPSPESEEGEKRPTIVSSIDAVDHLRFHRNPAAKLRAVLEIARHLGQSLDIDEVLTQILDSAFRVYPQAERGYMLLIDDLTGRLEPRAFKMRQDESEPTLTMQPISRTITRQVMSEGKAVLSSDVLSDRRFERSQSVLDFEIRSMMCAPLIGPSRRTLGIMYIDTQDPSLEFDEDDLDVLVSVAAMAAQAVEYARLHTELLEQQRRAEETLRASEMRFRAVWENSADAMRLTDEQGQIIAVNQAYCDLVGLPPAELQGKPFTVAYPGQEDADRRLRDYRRQFHERTLSPHIEKRLTFRSEQTVDLTITNTLIPIEPAHCLLLTIYRDVTEQKRLQKEIADLAVQEQQRIGQELHDELGQLLTGLSYMGKTLHEQLQRREAPEAKTAGQLIQGLQRALKEVRAIAKGLVPVEVDAEGLRHALQELTIHLSELYGIECRLRCSPAFRVEDSNTALHLYHIAQEAITNAVKHGGPKNIVVELAEFDHQMRLSVRDDGVGLEQTAEQPSGIGLRIMRYRAGIIGGTLDIRPGPDGGTQVTCTLRRPASPSSEER